MLDGFDLVLGYGVRCFVSGRGDDNNVAAYND